MREFILQNIVTIFTTILGGSSLAAVLKVNHEQGTLRYLGKPLYNIINKLDPGHFDNLKF